MFSFSLIISSFDLFFAKIYYRGLVCKIKHLHLFLVYFVSGPISFRCNNTRYGSQYTLKIYIMRNTKTYYDQAIWPGRESKIFQLMANMWLTCWAWLACQLPLYGGCLHPCSPSSQGGNHWIIPTPGLHPIWAMGTS